MSSTSMAARADKYALYQASVQDPAHDVSLFTRYFKSTYGRAPKILREDFCGTAAVCCEWARSDATHHAWGVDLDPSPLKWGADFNRSTLDKDAQARVHLVKGDVRSKKTPPADVIAAQNFSFFIFKTREELRRYFRATWQHLGKEGILVLDMMGGSALLDDDVVETRRISNFHYVWDQVGFDPITHDIKFYIHFKFKDGSQMKRAFTYDWRLWFLPEINELLTEAGFKRVDVYWQDLDSRLGHVYRKRRHARPDPAWLACLVAVK